MLLRSATSSLLAAWVAFACPLLCTMTALPDGQAPRAAGNCCDRCGDADSPADRPPPAQEPPTGFCFCSQVGAFLSADDQLAQLTALTIIAVAAPESEFVPARTITPAVDTLIQHRPPDLERTLPLLI